MTLTAEEVNDFKDAIFINFPVINNDFEMLLDSNQQPLFDMEDAKRVARRHFKGINWQLSNLDQALIKNGQVNNF